MTVTRHFLVLAAAAAALGLTTGCSQNYEAGSHPPPKPPQKPAVPAGHPATGEVPGQPAVFSGTIRVASDLVDRIPQRAYLYVLAREEADGGLPYAVKRIPVPRFPYAYSLSQSDVMSMGGDPTVLADAKAVYLVARIDADGLAGVAPGDLEGVCPDNPVSGVGQDLDILIDTLH